MRYDIVHADSVHGACSREIRCLEAARRFGIQGQVIYAVEKPDRIDYRRLPLLIAQKEFDKTRVLRVVYRKEEEIIVVITFYPGRKSQYEKEN